MLLDQSAQIAEWNGLKLSVNQLRALGELKARELDKDTKFSGGLSIAPMNLREFLAGIGVTLPAMADANTLGKFELNTRLAGSRNSLNLEDLKLGLDDTAFSGRFGIADFARQSLRAQLKGDKLDLDRYLPAKAKQAQDAASATRKAEVDATVASAAQGNTPLPEKPTRQAWSDAPLLPIATLRKLDLDVALNFGRLTVEKLPIDDASLKLRGQGGVISLDDMRGGLYNGRFNAKANLDVRQDSAVLTATKHIANDAGGAPARSPGQETAGEGAARPRCRHPHQRQQREILDRPSQRQRTLQPDQRRAARRQPGATALPGHRYPQPQGPCRYSRRQGHAFRELKGSLNFTNGVASNPDLKVAIPGLAVSGHGDIDLRVLGMDYRIGVEIQGDKSDMPDPACQVNQRYAGIEWPLLCRGPLELGAKACRLDKEGMGKVAAKLAGNRLNEKLEEKLGDKVSPELKDALKGLFNRK